MVVNALGEDQRRETVQQKDSQQRASIRFIFFIICTSICCKISNFNLL